ALPPASLELVRIAACVGYRVELRTLAAVVERPPVEVFSQLWPVFEQGLLLIEAGLLDEVEGIEVGALASSLEGLLVRFGHARIQQATLASLTDAERVSGHASIGRVLRERLARDDQAALAFEAADQLNAGRSLLGPDERRD